jgi:hypothetical protein
MRYGLVWHYIFAIFFYGAINYLAWYYFSRCCGQKSRRLNIIFPTLFVLFGLCVSYDALQFVNGVYNSGVGEFLGLLGMSWLLGGAFTVVLLLLFFVINLAGKIFRRQIGAAVRKVFLFIALLLYLTAFLGMYNGWSTIVVNTQQFTSEKIKRPGVFRIAYFSDLHLGNVYNLATLDRTLTLVGAQRPDALLIGGDLFDDEREIVPALKKLDEFGAAYAIPIYFVLGNHEYYCNIAKVLDALAKSRVKLLNNAHVQLSGDNVYLLGVDYPLYEGGMRFDRKLAELNLRTALLRVPENSLRVLLAHSPEYIEVINNRVLVDLVLSGHTHGGQVEVGPLNFFKAKFRYLRGRYELPNLTAVVSTGVGGWLPFRFNCPAEINIIDIEAK